MKTEKVCHELRKHEEFYQKIRKYERMRKCVKCAVLFATDEIYFIGLTLS